MTLWLAQVQEEEQRSLYSLQSSTNRFSDKIVQTCDIKSYVTTFDIPTNPPIKKNTVVEFTAVAQKDSSLRCETFGFFHLSFPQNEGKCISFTFQFLNDKIHNVFLTYTN